MSDDKESSYNAEVNYHLSAAKIENKFLKSNETFDVLILDIDMSQLSGLELAKRLR